MIAPETETAMRAALAALEAAADRAEAAAPGMVTEAWLSLIGAGSTADARTELARRFRADADRLRARLVSLLASPTATEAEGRAFVRDATTAAGGIAEFERGADALTPSGAAAEVVGATAKDLGLPSAAGAVRAVKIGAAVVAAAVLVLVLRDARRAVRG